MKYLLIILLSFFGLSGYSQLMQTNGTAGGYQFVALKGDSLFIIPRGIDTPAIGPTKYGKSTVGALFYKTTDSTFWVKSSNKWNQISGTGGGIQSVVGGYRINVDATDPVNPIVNSLDTSYHFIFEAPIQANVSGDTVYVYLDSTGNGNYSIAHHSFGYYLGVFLTSAQAANTYITYDSAQGKYVDTGYISNDTIYLGKGGVYFPIGVIPASASGGISEVIADWGLININDSTLKVDSFLVASRARVDKVADSLGVIIATKQAQLNGTGFVKATGTTITYDNTTYLSTGVYEVKIATAGQTAVTFTSVPTTSATYNVFINGSACPKSYYSVASNTITFSAGLTLNDVIMIQGVQ